MFLSYVCCKGDFTNSHSGVFAPFQNRQNIDALQLQVGVSMVGACGVNAVLVRDNFPELRSDLVTALAALDVNELTHGWLLAGAPSGGVRLECFCWCLLVGLIQAARATQIKHLI